MFEDYKGEGLKMPYTWDDFNRDFTVLHFDKLTPEQRAEAIQRLSPEKRRETLQNLSPELLLEALSAEQIEALQNPQQPSPSSAKQGRAVARADAARIDLVKVNTLTGIHEMQESIPAVPNPIPGLTLLPLTPSVHAKN